MNRIKKEIFILLVLILALGVNGEAQSSLYAQIDTVLAHYRNEIFKNNSLPNINRIIHSVRNADETSYGQWGIWLDIDYENENRSDWKLMKHLRRVEEMAIVWSNPKSCWYHNDTLWKDINKTLNFWLFHRFYNPNWYENEISVPMCMQSILILLQPYLTKYQRIRCLEEMDQFRINGTGSNLIQSAKIGFFYGALTRDTLLMRHCIDTIYREIKINTGEGIQPDYSFHMHLNRLQIYSYGRSYLRPILKLALHCKGTAWEFPSDKIRLLDNFILKGWQWMCRGINNPPGTLDRGISRKDALHAADIRNLITELIEFNSSVKNELKAFFDRQNGIGVPLIGFRYYPYSDFAAYQCKEFSFFLKTISTRTLPSESINGENLKGHLLNDGDAYLIHDGNEYLNLMPVWDWNKIPGITSFKRAKKIIRKPFVGSVSDSESGLTVMDYDMEGSDSTEHIYAHKIWACHNDLIVSLIAGLTAKKANDTIFTVLDQCRWHGPVTVNKPSNIIEEGDQILRNVRWIHHGKFTYIPLKPATIHLFIDTVTGRWKSINTSKSDSLVKDSVFMPLMIHGENPTDLSTGYVLSYCSTAKKAAKLANNPSWKILRNDTLCQAVQFTDGTLMAAFYAPTIFRVTINQQIEVSRPCLLLLSKNKLYVSDPMHQGGKIGISINQYKIELELRNDGTTKEYTLISNSF